MMESMVRKACPLARYLSGPHQISSMENKRFYVLFALILLVGFGLRFYDLTKRPIHHDEGVIGWFKLNILNACLNPNLQDFDFAEFARACGSSYTYDPDYHGPFEYLFGAWVFRIFGASDFTLRAPECLFALATIALLLPLRKNIGDVGTLVAGALLAVSPSMVYYSQRAYMDNFFIFFTLGAVVCAVKYWEERKDLWLYLGAVDLALLFTTKETAFIFVFTAAAFAVFTAIGSYCSKISKPMKAAAGFSKLAAFIREKRKALAIALAAFAITYIFVFSTMFFDPIEAWNGATKGLVFWLNRSTTWEGHFKPFGYYYGLLVNYEHAILFLSVGTVLFSMRDSFARWCAFWAFSTWLIFSLIPYKTPWLDPHFILPMAIVAGIGIDTLTRSLNGWQRFLPILVVLPLLAISTFTAWDVTYVRYADEKVALVYVSTVDSYKALVERIENESKRFQGTDTPISIVSTDYWPLPWSLRDYKRVAYYGRSVYGQDAPIIISSRSDYSEIKPELRSAYLPPE